MITENSQSQAIQVQKNFLFTVFTATYNRAHTLPRVYESLRAQTLRDFEWIIVDDGSTDNTRELVKKWQQENYFPIRYFYQENSGKHIAFNQGVQYASGLLFLNLDSDDACVPSALERFKYYWDSIPAESKEGFSAVTCLSKKEDGRLVGGCFPFNPTDSNSLEIRYRFKVIGEKWGFHRTDVLKKFPFPELPNCKFVPEDLVWSHIAKSYKTRFVNEALRVYYKGTDQLTRSGSPQDSAIAHAFRHQAVLNNELDYFFLSPANFMRSAVHYSRFSFHLSDSPSKQLHELYFLFGKILYLIALPVGYVVYLLDKQMYR